MNNYHFILLLCTVALLDAGTSEFVWLKDLNNDAEKRHVDFGLSEELRFQLNRGQKSVHLHLRENPHIRADTDIYVVQSLPDGTKRAVKETFTQKIETKYYHDIDNSAFVTVRCLKREEDPCTRTLEGSLRIGEKDFYITPVSDSKNVERFYKDLDSHGTPHFLQEHRANGGENNSSDEDLDLNDDYKIAPNDTEEVNLKETLFVRLRRLLDNLHPEEMALYRNKRVLTKYGVEVLVAVDPPIWQKFYALAKGSNEIAMNRVKEYISQVFNGVDLRYKTITGRSFSIYVTLKRIIVIKTEADAPFISVKPFTKDGILYIKNAYLNDFTKWVMNTPEMASLSDFDHAMMISGYKFDSPAVGIAFLNAVCTELGTSIVEEKGYFATMHIAAHELGHSLGARHDGSGEASACDKTDNFIMKPYVAGFGQDQPYNPNPWTFSRCSIDGFEKNLASKSCVLDKATFYDKQNYDYNNRLNPGEMYGLEEQCKLVFGEISYKCSSADPQNTCLVLQCYNPKKGSCGNLVPANGTPCGSGNRWCINGLCVLRLPGVTTPKTTTTTTPRKNATTYSSTRAPTTQPSTQSPSCTDISSDIEEPDCKDTGYHTWSCATIRQKFASQSQFCSQWSKYCCASCS